MAGPLYGCALFLDVDAAAPFAMLRARFDPAHASKIAPHVTLKQAFGGPQPDSVEEQALIAALVATATPFVGLEVHLDELGSFHSPHYGWVVYAKVDGGPALPALSAAMVRVVATLGYMTPLLTPALENELYCPHLTLAQGLSESEAWAALDLTAPWRPSVFTLHRLGVARRERSGAWRAVSEHRLASGTHAAPSVMRRSSPSKVSLPTVT